MSRSTISASLTSDQVADALRQRIQTRQIAPGAWLREVRLCEEFDVGRSLIRRALRTLAEDGLVRIQENRGACVSEPTIEEVFDLYEVRAALYGLVARFACMRAPDAAMDHMLSRIDDLLDAAREGASAETIMEISEALFTAMTTHASADAQRMVEAIRRKTRWHFSYSALALSADGAGPYRFWREIRAGFVARDAARASQGARDLIHFMQQAVSSILLASGTRLRAPGIVSSQSDRDAAEILA
ncbi:GntR family transcriptional regulator [Novosphingobium sp. 9U]|uniref:GntR family transcriptional regulator n=1 Tax=Novosphingobium sp. 9U TaxID=2653158 RepID=UPI0012F2E399|nr:GntR family transcriptional regulator [Novosphingobium sp. 9U]VWX55059.1 GntR family transcriptional regulator [Novosphingobium sp. 9U]